jgi:hypothetical protein
VQIIYVIVFQIYKQLECPSPDFCLGSAWPTDQTAVFAQYNNLPPKYLKFPNSQTAEKERKKMNTNTLFLNPLIIQLKMKLPPQFPAKKTTTKSASISARLQNSQTPTNQQLNLSVLRFTLGIYNPSLLSLSL